jgi:ssDNA-binding Zn-finger/Zn-ribbon topoisomerase 1
VKELGVPCPKCQNELVLRRSVLRSAA